MKVETPQILWHNGSEGNGKPAPLYSVALLPSPSSISTSSSPSTTTASPTSSKYDILATAGNTNEVHTWKINFPLVPKPQQQQQQQQQSSEGSNKRQKIISNSCPEITHITTITRHQRSVNTVAFSPYGTHLATAGDGGTFIVHTVPSPYRQSQSMQTTNLFWKTQFSSEKDLTSVVINTRAEDVMDLSWSSDEKRIILGSLDHSVFVYEESYHPHHNQANAHAHANQAAMGSSDVVGSPSLSNSTSGSKWNCVWMNTKEHTHYVQGVAYDPLGVYLASQGSDRSVRVWQRKRGVKNKSKKVLSVVSHGNSNDKSSLVDAMNANATNSNINANANANATTDSNNERPMGKFEVSTKAKVLKYRSCLTSTATTNAEGNENNHNNNNNNNNDETIVTRKRHLFADESTVESFFRRLAWTKDGAFLITPASLWHSGENANGNTNASSNTPTSVLGETTTQTQTPQQSSSPSFATYLFARHQYDRPYKVLSGLEKPSVVIRPNPILFQLPEDAQSDSKENMNMNTNTNTNNLIENMPYRSIFAVLTVDSILIYDTYHSRPLCIARGLHYASLTDCTWSSNGRNLIVCSTDGYVSILSFAEGELGDVYLDPTPSSSSRSMVRTNNTNANVNVNSNANDDKSSRIGSSLPKKVITDAEMKTILQNQKLKTSPFLPSVLPPCEPGQSATLVAPPSKRARVANTNEKKRVVPTLLSSSSLSSSSKVGGNSVETEVVGAVTNLSIDNDLQGKMNGNELLRSSSIC